MKASFAQWNETTGGKLFATFYSLYSGIAFLSLMALLLAPVYHRFLHKFHLESEEEDEEKRKAESGKPDGG